MKSTTKAILATTLSLLLAATPTTATAATKAENAFLTKVYNASVNEYTTTDMEEGQLYYMLDQLEMLNSVPENRSRVLSYAKGLCTRLAKSSSTNQLKLTEAYAAKEMINIVNGIYDAVDEDELWYQVAYVTMYQQATKLATKSGGLCAKQASRGLKLSNNVLPLITQRTEEAILAMYETEPEPEFIEELE